MKKFTATEKLMALFFIFVIITSLYQPIEAKADAPTAYTFSTFSATVKSNNVAPFSKALDVSGIPANKYLFFTVVADYTSDGMAWSQFMNLKFTDSATTVFLNNISASQGIIVNSATSTTLYWTGILEREYTGGGNLTIHFSDLDTSGTYTSNLTNVVVTLYPTPTKSTTFTSFNTGTITSGDGIGYVKSFDFSHLPYGYLFYTVTADWNPVSGSNAYSQSMKLTFYDGSATYYSLYSARQGSATNNTPTSLYWAGIFQREYTGGGNLTMKFIDNDSGSYLSQLTNVVVSIYPSPTIPKTFTAFTTDTITDGGTYSKSLDVSGLSSDDYLFFTAVADYKGETTPPNTNDLQLKLTNGSDVIYIPSGTASQGATNTNVDTTLYWSGIFQRKYIGGGNLSAIFSITEYPTETATCHLENMRITILRAAGTGATAIHLTGLKASNEISHFMQAWQLLLDLLR